MHGAVGVARVRNIWADTARLAPHPPPWRLAQGGRTHCGVLEFTAEEGTVGLPPKVIQKMTTREAQIGRASCRERV